MTYAGGGGGGANSGSAGSGGSGGGGGGAVLEMDLMQRSIQAAAVVAPTATHRGTAVLEVPALSSFDMQTLTTQQLPQLVRRP